MGLDRGSRWWSRTSAACLICAALEWAVKRWATAQLLKITIRSDNVRQLLRALACTRPHDLAKLTEVSHAPTPFAHCMHAR